MLKRINPHFLRIAVMILLVLAVIMVLPLFFNSCPPEIISEAALADRIKWVGAALVLGIIIGVLSLFLIQKKTNS